MMSTKRGKMIVYTWGYSKRMPEDLLTHGAEGPCGLVVDHNIRHIIDVRARPWSHWRPEWNRNALQQRFGPRYIWAPCFGNPEAVTPDGWRGWLDQSKQLATRALAFSWAHVIHSGGLGNVLLLCLEQDPLKCHRSAVAEFIGCKTIHLGVPDA